MALYSYIYLVLLIKCLHGFKLLIKEIYAHVTRDVFTQLCINNSKFALRM